MRRRAARELAVQGLYQVEMNNSSIEDASVMAWEEDRDQGPNENEVKDTPKERVDALVYAKTLINGVQEHLEHIDIKLSAYLKDWRMDRLSRVDRQILRLAVYEMIYLDDVPPKVAVNEAIELAKHFGTEESGKFVNGVLGQMLHQIEELQKP